ncbi:MAG: uracil-DNA glycosylase [Oscillospiraceae bacterium]|nr:uracil-DNA glycosylase [Oscillospiraceae bacterium]
MPVGDQKSGWKNLMDRESEKAYYKDQLEPFIEQEYASGTVYPEREKIFRALELTPLQTVKAVILGQDPYHEPGQAHGLAFSVPEGAAVPPSLRNIYEEINAEYGCGIPKSGNLEPWARQGVLLLNTVLTVRAHKANSHAGHGWELFTDAVLLELGRQEHPIVFMLWGSHAQKKETLIEQTCHLILKTSHPSPLSVYRGFRGCGHFKACNAFLAEKGLQPINWIIGSKEVDACK